MYRTVKIWKCKTFAKGSVIYSFMVFQVLLGFIQILKMYSAQLKSSDIGNY